MNGQETFTTRLRRYRERSGIPLDAVARETRVKIELLEGLERNDLSAWPRGVYARAYVRAYAAAIGLDGADTVDEFCRLFPQGDRRTDGVIREIAAIVASPSELRNDFGPERDRRKPTTTTAAQPTRLESITAVVRRVRGFALGVVAGLGVRSSRPSTRSATR